MSGKTNHRLHCNHHIPDKTIQVQTGHKRIDSLRVERPKLEEQQEACEALADIK